MIRPIQHIVRIRTGLQERKREKRRIIPEGEEGMTYIFLCRRWEMPQTLQLATRRVTKVFHLEMSTRSATQSDAKMHGI